MRTTVLRLVGRFVPATRAVPRKYTRHEPFVDRVKALVSSGRGGDGAAKFLHLPNNEFAGPSGANGGTGGSMFVTCTRKYADLAHIRAMGPNISAERGYAGGTANRRGMNGSDMTLEVPPGTIITDVDTGQTVLDLDEPNQTHLLLEGGKGGKGNRSFANFMIHSPLSATQGLPGNAMLAQFELKMIADVGLVGFPNAGKSSILAALSTAQPRIEAFPFTSLYPTIGRLQNLEGYTCDVADLPGLIEGAYENRGLGHQFLRHVERTSFIALVIDMVESYTPPERSEPPHPWDVFDVLMDELEFFLPGLSQRVHTVFANKMDVDIDPTGTATKSKFETLRKHVPEHIFCFPVSAQLGRQYGFGDVRSGLREPVHVICEAVFASKRAQKKAREEARQADMDMLDRLFREANPQYYSKNNVTLASQYRVHYVTSTELGKDKRYDDHDRPLTRTEQMLRRRREKEKMKPPHARSIWDRDDVVDDILLSEATTGHRSLVDEQLEAIDGDFGVNSDAQPYLDLPRRADLNRFRDVTTQAFTQSNLQQP